MGGKEEVEKRMRGGFEGKEKCGRDRDRDRDRDS